MDGKGTLPVNSQDMSKASGSWMYFAKHLYPIFVTKHAHPKNKIKEKILDKIENHFTFANMMKGEI